MNRLSSETGPVPSHAGESPSDSFPGRSPSLVHSYFVGLTPTSAPPKWGAPEDAATPGRFPSSLPSPFLIRQIEELTRHSTSDATPEPRTARIGKGNPDRAAVADRSDRVAESTRLGRSRFRHD
jgi:hypothetical protein